MVRCIRRAVARRLLLPEAVAYSSIANLPPAAGVIALFAGLVCYGLIGTSRFAIVSATSSSAAVLAAASATLGNGNGSLRLTMATALVLMSGLLFMLAAAARIGSVSDFIAKPVLRGFAFGLALVIILKQFAHVVGVPLHHTDVVRLLIELFSQFAHWNWPAVAMTLAALVVLLICARIAHLPGGLIVIVFGIAAAPVMPTSAARNFSRSLPRASVRMSRRSANTRSTGRSVCDRRNCVLM